MLPEKDNLYTILADLKRTAREYTTAVTESKNPHIRQLFTALLDSTLAMQGRLYEQMQLNSMYNASSPALRQELDKQLHQYAQTEQETAMFLDQTLGAGTRSVGSPPHLQAGLAQPMTSAPQPHLQPMMQGAPSSYAQLHPHMQEQPHPYPSPFGGTGFPQASRPLPYM
ncbi:spore coat protein [Paenibacillus athensensis]|uniref:Spore coat protein n=2 Tax=Paenibacillus athensensis TaxID=1967502 RepID=A0A4Y8Q2T0_9BACL|nr:spore coat protein [Paenibacillus athensensis]